ncbi:hypothetical protein HKX48_002610, partial [Thoreauomyces humboldtii]
NTEIMTQASEHSTMSMSEGYLGVLLQKVKNDAEAPIALLTPLVASLGQIPEIAATFSNPSPLVNLIASPNLDVFANMKVQNNLDFCMCLRASWKPGFNASHNPAWNADPDTIAFYNSTTIDYAYNAWTNALLSPFDMETNMMSIVDGPDNTFTTLYPLDPISRIPQTTGGQVVPLKTTLIPDTGLMQLGLLPPYNQTFFSLTTKYEVGLTIGLIGKQFWATGTSWPSAPTFACLAGAKMASTWIQICRDAKPLTNSVVAMFDSKSLSVIASSNMVVNTSVSQTPEGLVYGSSVVDAQSAAFQVAMQDRYAVSFGVN